jgi:hypothetical protein
MRPPRIAIIAFFLASSLFLLSRSIGSIATALSRSTTLSEVARTGSPPQSFVSGFFSLKTPFALFPPSAAISLTDDNGTTFAARPAAFGPPLPIVGLSGQLWVGGGFDENGSSDTDETGCGDYPGHDDGQASTGSYETPAASLRESLDIRTDEQVGQPAHYQHGGNDAGLENMRLLQESADISDKVVLLSRGGCGFVWKIRWAQRRGARAVIIGDNQRGASLIQMFAKGDTSDVTIPAVFTARTTALVLSSLSLPGGMRLGVKKQEHHETSTSSSLGEPSASQRSSGMTAPPPDQNSRDDWKPWFVGNTAVGVGHKSGILTTSLSHGRPALDSLSPGTDRSDRDHILNPRTSRKQTLSMATGRESLFSAILGAGKRIGFAGKEQAHNFNTQVIRDNTHEVDDDEYLPHHDQHLDTIREGLWVTLAPTSSTSPLFDTLLVLVISPLVTLVVVYALLIIRARIRRRRWRAPKSIIDRLPIRTYHTVAHTPSDTPRLPSPDNSSPSTPSLQQAIISHEPAETLGVLDDPTGLPISQSSGESSPSQSMAQLGAEEPESRGTAETQAGRLSSQWYSKYMNRQVECVVCLEEYVDGVSQVMSLPCGHEFHAECM